MLHCSGGAEFLGDLYPNHTAAPQQSRHKLELLDGLLLYASEVPCANVCHHSYVAALGLMVHHFLFVATSKSALCRVKQHRDKFRFLSLSFALLTSPLNPAALDPLPDMFADVAKFACTVGPSSGYRHELLGLHLHCRGRLHCPVASLLSHLLSGGQLLQ